MDEVEAAEERRQEFLDRLEAVADAFRASAAGKWVEVRQGKCVYAINASRITQVAVYERGDEKGLKLYDNILRCEGWLITHIGDKPATVENWLRAVEG